MNYKYSSYYTPFPFSSKMYIISCKSELDEIEKIMHLNKHKFEEWLICKLSNLVDYAYVHVPFYHELYAGGYKLG